MKIKFTIFILILYLSIPSVARDFYGAAEVPVVFEATDSYTGFQTQITLSAALSFEKLGEAYVTIGDNIKSTHQISAKLNDGVLKVVRFSPTNAVLPNGTLFNIKLPSTANFSDGTISFSNTIFSSTANADVSFPTSTGNVSVGAPAPTSITLSDPTLTITDSGNTYIYATVKPIGLTTPVEWTSSDPSVASIICDEPIPDKKNGEVEAKVVGHIMGTATITATCGGKSTTCQITVTKTPLSALSFNPSSIDLKLGETDKLNPVFSPANATFKTVTYVSKQPLVATVDEEGNITTHQIGTAEIEGTCDGKTAIARVTVSRPDITSISLSAPKTTITDSETVQVSATFDPIDSQTNLTWSSSNKSVATVDNKGLVSGVARGNVTITASTGGKTATIDITVIDTPAASISLNKTSLSLKTTETAQLTATVLPETTTDKTVTWTSSDTSIATVDATGKITAVAVGNVTITATCGEASATCEVTVATTEAESIVLNMTSVTLKATETAQLNATVLPETTTDKSVTWTSSDTSVATVDATSIITAVAVGNATITATCGKVSATCEVTVIETAAEKVEVKIDIAEIKVGESTKIEVEVYPATTTDKTVTITSSDPDVVTVDEDGNIIAVGVGEATITVTCGDVTATTTITVLPTPAELITIDSDNISSIKVRENLQLSAIVEPEDTTYPSVEWSSSDSHIATVDEYGLVSAVGPGEVDITAYVKAEPQISATYHLTIEALLLGDANDNGEVDVFDVVTIGNYIAEKNPQTFCFVAADIINDNEINVADQNAAICISLGLDYETENNTAARAPKSVSDKFVINTSAATDGNACVSISLDNTIEYSSLQANIIIPEGMIVAKVRAGKRAIGHSIIYNTTENGVLKLVLYSLDNSALPVSDEPIVEISLATNGVSGELTIHDALASNASCSLFGLQPAVCLINDESSLSRIASDQLCVWGDDGSVSVINAQGSAVEIYDMGGRRVVSAVAVSPLERYTLPSGTYIVSAGTKSFKIIVK